MIKNLLLLFLFSFCFFIITVTIFYFCNMLIDRCQEISKKHYLNFLRTILFNIKSIKSLLKFLFFVFSFSLLSYFVTLSVPFLLFNSILAPIIFFLFLTFLPVKIGEVYLENEKSFLHNLRIVFFENRSFFSLIYCLAYMASLVFLRFAAEISFLFVAINFFLALLFSLYLFADLYRNKSNNSN